MYPRTLNITNPENSDVAAFPNPTNMASLQNGEKYLLGGVTSVEMQLNSFYSRF